MITSTEAKANVSDYNTSHTTSKFTVDEVAEEFSKIIERVSKAGKSSINAYKCNIYQNPDHELPTLADLDTTTKMNTFINKFKSNGFTVTHTPADEILTISWA